MNMNIRLLYIFKADRNMSQILSSTETHIQCTSPAQWFCWKHKSSSSLGITQQTLFHYEQNNLSNVRRVFNHKWYYSSVWSINWKGYQLTASFFFFGRKRRRIRWQQDFAVRPRCLKLNGAVIHRIIYFFRMNFKKLETASVFFKDQKTHRTLWINSTIYKP